MYTQLHGAPQCHKIMKRSSDFFFKFAPRKNRKNMAQIIFEDGFI